MPHSDTRLVNVPVRIRTLPDVGEGVVEAYASVFDAEYRIAFGIDEAVRRGAFQRSIEAQPSIPVFYEHRWGEGPIGVTTEASEDDTGVRVRAQLFVDDNPAARAIWRAMEAGALREWSIGFLPTVIESEQRDDGTTLETIVEGELIEASVVVRGANPETQTVAVRSEAADDAAEESEPEPVLVDGAWERLADPVLRDVLREVFSPDS